MQRLAWAGKGGFKVTPAQSHILPPGPCTLEPPLGAAAATRLPFPEEWHRSQHTMICHGSKQDYTLEH